MLARMFVNIYVYLVQSILVDVLMFEVFVNIYQFPLDLNTEEVQGSYGFLGEPRGWCYTLHTMHNTPCM